MGLSSLTRTKVRYIFNPFSQSVQSTTLISRSASFNPNFVLCLLNRCNPICATPLRVKARACPVFNPYLLRWYSSSSIELGNFQHKKVGMLQRNKDGIAPTFRNPTRKQISKIIELVRNGDDQLESKLNGMNLCLSTTYALRIFRILNWEKTSALPFFQWVLLHQHSVISSNSELCSAMIHNCGLLGDYKTMHSLLRDFTSENVLLNKTAFGFLPLLISNGMSIKKPMEELVIVLNRVGGSSRSSGITGLIELLCEMGLFDMAKFVISVTDKKVSYYNILVREKCLRCDFQGAIDILSEMRQDNCPSLIQTYNFILSSLCKNDNFDLACQLVEEMGERDCSPDALSFEILISCSCKGGKLDIASKFLDIMVERAVEPRLGTHAAFIKGYFNSKVYEEAYNYVACSSDKYKHASNHNYSLLASLHHEKGSTVVALNILLEMLNKGIRPFYPVYNKVLKGLRNSDKEYLATDLENRFSSVSSQLTRDTR